MWKNNRRFAAALRESEMGREAARRFSDGLTRAGDALSRRQVLGYAAVGAAGATAMAAASGGATAAPTYLKGLGDFRQLRFANRRTGERLNVIYFADGEYIPEAEYEISQLCRDWRRNEIMPIDRRALDYAAAVYKRLETEEPLTLISGYRSPTTNEQMRRDGRGVAKKSFHTRGMALDVSLESRSVSQMYRAALSLNAGGVGRYTRSHFIHVDCGPARSWGR